MSMQKNNGGWTALHRAETFEVVKTLVEHGADIEAVSTIGNTPLIQNSECGRVDIVKYLLSVGANKEAKNNKGETAYDVAYQFYNWKGEDKKEQVKAELQKILK